MTASCLRWWETNFHMNTTFNICSTWHSERVRLPGLWWVEDILQADGTGTRVQQARVGLTRVLLQRTTEGENCCCLNLKSFAINISYCFCRTGAFFFGLEIICLSQHYFNVTNYTTILSFSGYGESPVPWNVWFVWNPCFKTIYDNFTVNASAVQKELLLFCEHHWRFLRSLLQVNKFLNMPDFLGQLCSNVTVFTTVFDMSKSSADPSTLQTVLCSMTGNLNYTAMYMELRQNWDGFAQFADAVSSLILLFLHLTYIYTYEITNKAISKITLWRLKLKHFKIMLRWLG